MMGDSAGGQLAMSTSLWARDHGWRIPGAILIYPATDYVSMVPGHPEESETSKAGDTLSRFLSVEDVRTFWKVYLPDDVRNDPHKQLDPAHSPLRSSEIQMLPSLQLISSKRDVLYEQAEHLVRLYRGKGLYVVHKVFQRLPRWSRKKVMRPRICALKTWLDRIRVQHLRKLSALDSMHGSKVLIKK